MRYKARNIKINGYKIGAIVSLSALGVGLFSSCSQYENVLYNPQTWQNTQNMQTAIKETTKEIVEQKVAQYIENPEQIQTDLDEIKDFQKNWQNFVQNFKQKAAQKWGQNNTKEPSREVMVKYSDNYQSRAEVDFANGKIKVSTIAPNPRESLKNAIVATLLTPEDPQSVDLYSDSAPNYNSKPYLLGLVKDHDGVVVQYEWRANRYAEHLLADMKSENIDGVENYFVEFPMVAQHMQVSEQKYGDLVATFANAYKLPQALVFGIIKTESSFNPYAVSGAPAYGLMQVVPTTAGRDAYKLLNEKDGTPTKEMLFTPRLNIQYGTTYLYILKTRYLAGIKNEQSLEYCAIAAYNTGAGNVLSAFSSDRKKAIDIINSMTSAQVYQKLRTDLKYEEARNYVKKVSEAKQEFIKAGITAQNGGLAKNIDSIAQNRFNEK